MPKWTLGSLKAHYDAILRERDRRYEQRFADAETATRAALAAAEKAVTKAEASADKRFEGVNEFRQALSDQTATFITRTEALALTERNAERVQELTNRVNQMEGHGSGLSAGYGYLIAAVTAVGAVITAVVLLATHHP